MKNMPWIALVLSGVPLLGCDGGGIALSDLGPRAAAAFCESAVRCGRFPDQATCVAASAPDLGQVMADVKAGKTTYDGVAAAACLSAGAAEGCRNSDRTTSPQSCLDIFKGTIAPGAACFANEECVSGKCNMNACHGNGPACCAGVCQSAAAKIAIGGDCANRSAVCVDGASCQTSADGTGYTCQARPAVGQPCTAGLGACATGLNCVADQTGSGVCARLPARGEHCDPQSDCDSSTDFCDPVSGTCVAAVAAGGACPAGTGCLGYALCDPNTGKCVAKSGAGERCESPGDCFETLDCSAAGVCALRAAAPVCPATTQP